MSSDLLQGLLQPALLADGGVAHGVPASAQLLGCPFTQVVSSRLFSISSRRIGFQDLNGSCSLAQFLLENLEKQEVVCLTSVLNSRSRTKEKVVFSFNSPLIGSNLCVFYAKMEVGPQEVRKKHGSE